MAKLYDMDKLFSANFEDNEVYNVTIVETENIRDDPPAASIGLKVNCKGVNENPNSD